MGWREIENCAHQSVLLKSEHLKRFAIVLLLRVECPFSWPRVFGAFFVCLPPARTTTFNYLYVYVYVYKYIKRNPLGFRPKLIIILGAMGVAFNNNTTSIMRITLEWGNHKTAKCCMPPDFKRERVDWLELFT